MVESRLPSSSWGEERTASIFSPMMMVQDTTDGGMAQETQDGEVDGESPDEYGRFKVPEPKIYPSTEKLLEEIKQSEHWKTFMKGFGEVKEEGEASEEEGPEIHSVMDKVNARFNGEQAGKDSTVDKEAFKNNLHKLKEKTGFPYVFCKKALEENNNDLEKAEKWMDIEAKELGLEKIKKIDNRMTKEGLVGVAWEKHHAALVEVNTETDFVSSNEKFHDLVNVVAKTCLQHTIKNNPDPERYTQVMLRADEIGSLIAEDKQSLTDHVNKTVALVGERLRLRRAALVSVDRSARVAALAHGWELENYKNHGRLGVVMVYRSKDYGEHSLEMAKQVCQHIIGMSPKTVEPAADGDKETALLTQKFVRDPTATVADVVARAGLEVLHFVRFERGEPTDDPTDLGSEPAKPLC